MTEDTYEARVQADTPATTVIRQHPLSDAIGRYEAWLKEIVPVAQTFAGHQSVSVIRPHVASDAYTIVLHFDSVANLRKWLDSETRVRVMEKIRPCLRAAEAIETLGDSEAGRHFPTSACRAHGDRMRCGRN
jgi:antibiotic biosynthesis monooxygenase (ABM) superfamily enzyme